MELEPVIGSLRSEVIQIPVKAVAVVLNAVAETVGLRDIDVALLVEGERGWGFDSLVLEIRLHLQRGALRNGGTGQNGSGDKSLHKRLPVLRGGRKFIVRVIGEYHVIQGNEAPVTLVVIHRPQACFFPHESRHVE